MLFLYEANKDTSGLKKKKVTEEEESGDGKEEALAKICSCTVQYSKRFLSHFLP